jgi:hypothetical protein
MCNETIYILTDMQTVKKTCECEIADEEREKDDEIVENLPTKRLTNAISINIEFDHSDGNFMLMASTKFTQEGWVLPICNNSVITKSKKYEEIKRIFDQVIA